LKAGDVKATYGTGCFINLNLGEDFRKIHEGLLTTIAWQRFGKVTYALDGGIFSAGSALEWLREMAFFQLFSEIDPLAKKAKSPPLCLPAFSGLAAPYWDRMISASWIGMNLSTSREDLIASVLDGIALRVAQVVRTMKSAGIEISEMTVDGGLTQSAYLMQRQADYLGIPISVSSRMEATVRGAAYIGFQALGIWTDKEVFFQKRIAKVFEPKLSDSEREERLEHFEKVVSLLRQIQ